MAANRFRPAESAAPPEAPPAAPRRPRAVPASVGWRLTAGQRLHLLQALGVSLLIFNCFLAVALFSHMLTGPEDQSLALIDPAPAANAAGKLGAWWAELLVAQGFGWAALLLPPYGLLLGLALLLPRYRRAARRLFGPFFGLLYGLSLFFGLLTLSFGLRSLSWSGALGLYLTEQVAFLIGLPGLAIVLAFAAYLALQAYLPQKPAWWRWLQTRLQLLQARYSGHAEAPSADAAPEYSPGTAAAAAHGFAPGFAPPPAASDDFFTLPTVGIPPALDLSDTETPGIPRLAPETEPALRATAAAFEVSLQRRAPEPPAEAPSPTQQDLASPLAPGNPVQEAIRAYTSARSLGRSAALSVATETGALPTQTHEFPLQGPPEDRLLRPQARAAAEVAFTIEAAPSPASLELSEAELPATNVYEVTQDQFAKLIPEQDRELLEDEDEVGDWEAYDPLKDLPNYRFPSLELLKGHEVSGQVTVSREELEYSKNLILDTLLNFKIEIESIRATIGPTVTLYEIVPKPHIRISKIKGLEDDIAMRLEALSSRIIAPMPGKGTIGIEVPNSKPELVSFRSLIGTEKFRNFQGELPVAFGKTVTNEVLVGDLTKMPHLLVAGATGQGKSVGLNCILASLLYKKHPSQVKFVLIDPKKVELNLFEALSRHYLAALPDVEEPIITDTKQVLRVLTSLCAEMDARYELLKLARCRNLLEYNAKFRERRLNPRKGHRYLPYIVLVIDELADLMMTAGKEVEPPICRLAQLARAIGIHLVVATQRPSVDIITGKIKANFPARVSYRVMSKVDSRTVLDANGAEQLIGRGDMLLKTGSDQVRLQNGFIDTDECERIVNFIAAQPGYSAPYPLPEVLDPEQESDSDDAEDGGERDPLFADAARLVVMHQQGSTSIIQRRLKLGYNRAGRIMDQLERAGIVGANRGSKARDVLVSDLTELELFL